MLHLQDYRTQVGTLDFRIGELGAGLKVCFGIKAYADTVGQASASPFALICTGLGDRLNG